MRRDLNSVLKYKPSRDVHVLLHDSFNTECRAGILSANWADARYVAFANLDFIPGQIMQQGGPFDGQLWGGLALVILKAEPQPAVQLLGTSEWMQRKCARPD